MNKKFILLVCSLMALVWTAGCSCPGPTPIVAAPPPAVAPAPAPYVPQQEAVKPQPVEPAPSKKLKKRVIKETND